MRERRSEADHARPRRVGRQEGAAHVSGEVLEGTAHRARGDGSAALPRGKKALHERARHVEQRQLQIKAVEGDRWEPDRGGALGGRWQKDDPRQRTHAVDDDTDGDDDMCCLAMSMCCWWAYFCGREDAVWIRYDSSEETAELQQVDLGASESLADD